MNPEEGSPAPRESSTPKPSEDTLKQIRTFQGDIAEALKQRNASVVSLARAEHAKVESKPAQPALSEDNKRVLLLTIGTLVLIALGGAGAWYSYTTYKNKTELPVVVVPDNRLIPTQNEISLNLTSLDRDALIGTLAQSDKAVKGVEQIQIHPSLGEAGSISTQTFLTQIGATPPSALLRAFNPVFMLGVYTDNLPHTFLLIKLDSFENAFPGMLEWEKIMQGDILPLFATPDEISLVSPGTKFEDVTIKNKDARVLRDVNGKTLLIYAFFDSHILIITDNEETLRTLITKITGELLVR